MQRINSLDINLILAPDEYQLDIHTFLKDRYYSIPNDLDTFSTINGGLEFIKDRIFSFYYSIGSFNLLDAVAFLLEGVTYCKGMKFEQLGFSQFSMENDGLVLQFVNHALFVHIFKKENRVVISYNSGLSSIQEVRNNPYFDSFEIDIDVWVEASIIALKEYFSMVEYYFYNELNNKDISSGVIYLYNIYRNVVQSGGVPDVQVHGCPPN